MYRSPEVHRGGGVLKRLRDLPGRCVALTMPEPWALVQERMAWDPAHVHHVRDMAEATVERLAESLPPCDVVVGVGGGSCVDAAKYLAWKRGCRMVLVPSIISVDAPFTNTVAVRVDNTVKYVGDRYPEEILIDYDLIAAAPPELNRAGACDIASIHTALYDWNLAHERTGEAYDPGIANEAAGCLAELDRHAEDVFAVNPRGIDTIVDLYIQEVEFCARLGSSRPEEGSEHIVAYHMEHLTRRHFLHGDLVAFGLFTMSLLQKNDVDWIVELMDRTGLRYRVPDASAEDKAACLRGLRAFKESAGLFYSVVDAEPIDESFVARVLERLAE